MAPNFSFLSPSGFFASDVFSVVALVIIKHLNMSSPSGSLAIWYYFFIIHFALVLRQATCVANNSINKILENVIGVHPLLHGLVIFHFYFPGRLLDLAIYLSTVSSFLLSQTIYCSWGSSKLKTQLLVHS